MSILKNLLFGALVIAVSGTCFSQSAETESGTVVSKEQISDNQYVYLVQDNMSGEVKESLPTDAIKTPGDLTTFKPELEEGDNGLLIAKDRISVSGGGARAMIAIDDRLSTSGGGARAE